MTMWERRVIRMAGALLGIGLLIVAGAFAVSGFNPLELSRRVSGYEERTKDFVGEFSGVRVQDVDADVRIVPSESGRCSVHYDETKRSTYHIEIVNDELVIERERDWRDSFGIFWSAPKLTVYLPRAAYEAVNVHTVSGGIQIEGIECAELNIDVTSGGIRLTDVRVFSGPDFRMLDSGSSNAGCLSARTVSGGIRLDGVDAERLDLHTVSGGIKGTLRSGKVFEASSVSGRVRVPESTPGAGLCKASTTSGGISITVEE